MARRKTLTGDKLTTAKRAALSASLDMTYDPDTGEYCIGGDCYTMKWNDRTGETVHEYDSSAGECSPVVKKFAEQMMKRAQAGEAGRTVFRERKKRK